MNYAKHVIFLNFKFSLVTNVINSSTNVACRGCAEVAGWTVDWKIRVRFPAYPHCVWAL